MPTTFAASSAAAITPPARGLDCAPFAIASKASGNKNSSRAGPKAYETQPATPTNPSRAVMMIGNSHARFPALTPVQSSHAAGIANSTVTGSIHTGIASPKRKENTQYASLAPDSSKLLLVIRSKPGLARQAASIDVKVSHGR